MPKPTQKILGRSVHDHLRGFGYCISNPADIDANGYNGNQRSPSTKYIVLCCYFLDVAVGAYQSGHVVIIQSKPIVTIFQTLKPITVLNPTSQYVETQACFRYEAKTFNRTISKYAVNEIYANQVQSNYKNARNTNP